MSIHAAVGAAITPAAELPSVNSTNAFERFFTNQFAITTRGPSSPSPGCAIPKSAHEP